MRTIVTFVVLVVCCAIVFPTEGMAQKKLAQTGMKFLNVMPDARAVGLGEAFTAVSGTSSSLFYNTSAMARLEGTASVSLSRTNWIADINYVYASAAFKPFEGEYGVVGVMFQIANYGDFEETVRWPNDLGYLDLGTFKPTSYLFGVGYARALNDKFSVGGNVKYVHQSLGDAVNALGPAGELILDENGKVVRASNSTGVFAFDFGILYYTGFKSLSFGMTVRNFSKEVTYIKEGFQLPLTFRIGMAMNLLDLTEVDATEHQFLLAVDAEHPRDYQEQIRVGGEYLFMNLLALRAGYVSGGDEYSMSYGIGLRKDLEGVGLAIDYAYTPWTVFSDVHRFSFQFSL
ncbi:MAG: PorV/PorQ family protein [Bacteroidetes bacterium]|nr:PorV/PorQ family protein [Bacteroidota bacterium]